MAEHDIDLPDMNLEQKGVLKPPATSVGALGWVYNNLFNNWYNSILTVLGIVVVYFVVVGAVSFVIESSHQERVLIPEQYALVPENNGNVSLHLQKQQPNNSFGIHVYVDYSDNGVAKTAEGVIDIASGNSAIHIRDGQDITIESAGIALEGSSDAVEITEVRTVFNRWTVIPSNLTLLMVGRYPQDQLNRPWYALVFIALMMGLSAGLWGGLVRQIGAVSGIAFVIFLFVPFENNPREWLAITLGTGIVAFLFALVWPKVKAWAETIGITKKLLPSFGAISAIAVIPLAAWVMGVFGSTLPFADALHSPERVWLSLALIGFALGINGGIWRGILGWVALLIVGIGSVVMMFVIVLSVVPLQGILDFVVHLNEAWQVPIKWVLENTISFLMWIQDFVFIELLPEDFDKIAFWGLMLVISVAYAWGRNILTLKNLIYLGWALTVPVTMAVVGGIGTDWLPPINTRLWGGLMLTLMLSVVGIALSFPLGILLALGRRSQFPVVSGFCVLYIEVIRGVPLITILFMANIMIPLLLPGSDIENVFSAMAGIMLFSAAYMAENVRGGLQAIPQGQFEAGYAVGLNGWQSTLFITLPQALRTVIPAIVGQAIALFKDTTLVSIIGLFDFLLIGQAVINNRYWLGLWDEILFFVAIIYWIFCYSMSYISRRIETNLGVGER
jgi:His/Glu/Gln/Arg/opine family amino acid ABC transporter permease subunit